MASLHQDLQQSASFALSDPLEVLAHCRDGLVQLGHCCRALALSLERDVSMVMQGGVVGGIGPGRSAVERFLDKAVAIAEAEV